jgi:hypothetical protein
LHSRTNQKLQTPTTNIQRNSKIQIPKLQRRTHTPFWFDAWCLSGAWSLGFGVYRRCARVL